MSIFSFMQFIFGSVAGAADRIGRRPQFFTSTPPARLLSLLHLSRGVRAGGQSGVNFSFSVSCAFAGLCGRREPLPRRISPILHRQRLLAKNGADRHGVRPGFTLPAGGCREKIFRTHGPGWVAADFCTANFLLAYFILPESWKPSSEHAAQRPHLHQWLHTMRLPGRLGY